METLKNNILEEAAQLHRLMPGLADQERVESSVAYSEIRGEKKVRASSEKRIGSHLSRLTKLLENAGVESRAWDSAVEELVIEPDDIPESYWEQQIQIARDMGHGDIHLGKREKDEMTAQLQGAQRTGLSSWREYLERAGDQYPLWFKFYAWDGMSKLGTFNKQKGYFNKRSSGTAAPFPQLNPAALARVYDAIKDQGDSSEEIAKLVKSGNFNKLYSHLLLEQKTIISTPENPEDIVGEWKSYTKDDIQAITEAAEGTPWCIAGKDMAFHYTKGGGSFLLFHLQDPETGKTSPTAAASIRLDGDGRVVEISGLKGGSSQYLEDSLIPTVEEKVQELPGGERYLKAFEDKQMLIAMDQKFRAGVPFSAAEIRFLYELDRPIEYIDTYDIDPRPNEFRQDKSEHIKLLAEYEGISIKEAKFLLMSQDMIEKSIDILIEDGVDPTIVANRIRPKAVLYNIELLMNAGAEINLKELFDSLDTSDKFVSFTQLNDLGAGLDASKFAASFPPLDKIKYFTKFAEIGLDLDPDEIASSLDERTRLKELKGLINIGAHVDVDLLLKNVKPTLSIKDHIQLYLINGAKPETIESLLEINLGYNSSDLRYVAASLVLGEISSDQVMKILAGAKRTKSIGGVDFNSGDNAYRRVETLIKAGVHPDAILRSRVFDEYKIERSLETLIAKGAHPDELMDGLGPYFTVKYVDRLIDIGASIESVVDHIKSKPDYLLDNFELLNNHGANLSISEVIEVMNPNDILTRTAEAVRLGAHIDVNKILDDPRATLVWSHKIDDLLALGADKQKIADKLEPRDADFEYIGGYLRPYEGYLGGKSDLKKEHPDIYNLTRERFIKILETQRRGHH